MSAGEALRELANNDAPRWADPLRTIVSDFRAANVTVFWSGQVAATPEFSIDLVQTVRVKDGEKQASPVLGQLQWHREDGVAASRESLDAVSAAFREAAYARFPLLPDGLPEMEPCAMERCENYGCEGDHGWMLERSRADLVPFDVDGFEGTNGSGAYVQFVGDGVEIRSVDEARQLLHELQRASERIEALLLGPDAEVKLTPSTAAA